MYVISCTLVSLKIEKKIAQYNKIYFSTNIRSFLNETMY